MLAIIHKRRGGGYLPLCLACLLIFCTLAGLYMLTQQKTAAPPQGTQAPPVRVRPLIVEADILYDTRNARVSFPRVLGVGQDSVADMVNRRLERDFALPEMEQFISDQRGSQIPWELDFGFSAEQIGEVLHLRALRYSFTGGAHGSTEKMDAYIDCANGAMYTLDDLFQDPPAARAAIAALIDRQIATHKEDFFPDAKAAPLPELFSFSPDGLVIEYPPYSIAPYASGFQAFTIPVEEVMPLIDTAAPFFSALKRDVGAQN